MELIKDTPFEVGWQVWMAKPRTPCLTIVVKASFTVVEKGDCPIDEVQELPTGDLHHDDDVDRSLRYASDFAPIKPRGECFVVGSCHVPGGAPVQATILAFKVGPVVKKVAVVGDRHFKGLLGGQTDPVPFAEMPLCWERSFGGAKSKENPVGLGMGKSVVDDKAVIKLPNFEDPDHLIRSKRDRPRPVGVSPIPPTWASRARLAGTYDGRWQRDRWPWFPSDLKWEYFNAAPEDQRITGFFKGDEAISLHNLHPEIHKASCRLPGLRARALLKHAEGDTLKVLKPDLDTIVVDADSGKVLCIWRAVTEVPSAALETYSHLFVVHEPLDARHTAQEYRAWFERCLAEQAEAEEAFAAEAVPEGDEITAGPVGPVAVSRPAESDTEESATRTPTMPPPARHASLPDPVPLDSPVIAGMLSPEELEQLFRDADDLDGESTEMMDPAQLAEALVRGGSGTFDTAKVAELLAEEVSQLTGPLCFEDELDAEATELMDAETFAATLAEAAAEPSGEDAFEEGSTMFFMAHLAAALEQEPGEQTGPQVGEHIEEPPEMAGVISREPDRPESAEAPAWAGTIGPASATEGVAPPTESAEDAEAARLADEQQARRREVLEALARGEGCAGWDLTEVDLSALDLAGADFSGAILTRADLSGADLSATDLTGATLSEADLTGARLAKTSFKEADLSGFKGRELRLDEVILEDAAAFGADLEGAVFVGCRCAGVDLGGAVLKGARFERTVLDEADLCGAVLDGATFIDASLVDADVSGETSARRVVMDRCDLSLLRADDGVRFDGASFASAKLTGARFGQAVLTRADLSFASLDGADFSDADLVQAVLLGCTAREARFDQARLVGANLGRSDLFKARFEGANLHHADLRGCNLFQAELLDAVLQDVRLELANVEGTKLA